MYRNILKKIDVVFLKKTILSNEVLLFYLFYSFETVTMQPQLKAINSIYSPTIYNIYIYLNAVGL